MSAPLLVEVAVQMAVAHSVKDVLSLAAVAAPVAVLALVIMDVINRALAHAALLVGVVALVLIVLHK